MLVVLFFILLIIPLEYVRGFSCYAGFDEIYKSTACLNGTQWCLKFVNKQDHTDALRRCDIANECENFGDTCSTVQVGELNNLPYSQIQCCCKSENCNGADVFSSFINFIALFSFYRFLN